MNAITLGAKDEAAARELAELMSAISEGCCCAAWLHGNEFHIWNNIHGEGRETHGFPTDSEVMTLLELSDRCGGWIVWRETDDAATFVPMEEWFAMVKHRRTVLR